MLTRLVRTQLVIFTIAGLVAMVAMAVKYIQVPSLLGIARTTVTVELPAAGGLYRFSNVTYRGVQIGKVTDVEIVRDGSARRVRATLSLATSQHIPSDVRANVRSVSAVGEQFVDLVPDSAGPPYLQDGSVIPESHTTIPQPIGPVMDNVSALMAAIPKDQLHSLVDETYQAFNGADYDLQSLLDSASSLSAKLNGVGERSRALIQDSSPLLDTQVRSEDAVRTWTRSIAGVSDQLVTNQPQIRSLLDKSSGAADEASRLLNDLNPTIPVLLANLTTISQLAITYHPALEQLLVLLPPVVSIVQSVQPNRNAQGLGAGSFRMTISDPPACTVGFLPPSSWRAAYDTTTIDTPDDLYCKLPQDSPIAVRGVRNFPCMTHPGKRAPTAEMCNSDQQYEPLAQKQPFLGPYPRDPNLEAQGVPPDSRWFPDQGLYSPPGQGPSAPETPMPPVPTTMPVPPPGSGMDSPPPGPNSPDAPVASQEGASVSPSAFVAETPSAAVQFVPYNPRTGEYVASDGKVYRQTNLTQNKASGSWKDLVFNPAV